jgi:hypothetical protein
MLGRYVSSIDQGPTVTTDLDDRIALALSKPCKQHVRQTACACTSALIKAVCAGAVPVSGEVQH